MGGLSQRGPPSQLKVPADYRRRARSEATASLPSGRGQVVLLPIDAVPLEVGPEAIDQRPAGALHGQLHEGPESSHLQPSLLPVSELFFWLLFWTACPRPH